MVQVMDHDTRGAPGGEEGARRRSRWLTPLIVVGAVLVAGMPAVGQGAARITDLGKPMDVVSLSSYFPLGGFRGMRPSPYRPRRTTVLALMDRSTQPSAMERWPLVKALGWFGTLSRVAPMSYDSVSACSPRFASCLATCSLTRVRLNSPW